jgi:hypothetical protein
MIRNKKLAILVYYVLFCLSSPAILFLPLPIACPVLPVLFCLLCSACPVLPVLFSLSCSSCPDLPVLFCLSCSGCPVLLSQSYFICLVLPVPAVIIVLAALSWQSRLAFLSSFSACHLLPAPFCSRSIFPVLSVLFCLLVLPVPLCLSRSAYPALLYRFCLSCFNFCGSACPVLPAPPVMAVLAVKSWPSCPGSPVLAFLS